MPNAAKTVNNSDQAVTRRYKNPPVHEVILDIQFHDDLPEPDLRGVRKLLAGAFAHVDEQTSVELLMSIGPSIGQESQVRSRKFAGWQFKDDGPNWVLRTTPSQLTLHAVQPGKWPEGKYVGWHAVNARFREVHELLSNPYGSLNPKRVGLRYLNRVAVPKGTDLRQWLQIPLDAPPPLRDLHAFNIRHTWAAANDYDDIGATVGFVKIDIEDTTLAQNHDGILLDIDLFNIWVTKAPDYAGLPDWYVRAHSVENMIFEGSITDALREAFDRP